MTRSLSTSFVLSLVALAASALPACGGRADSVAGEPSTTVTPGTPPVAPVPPSTPAAPLPEPTAGLRADASTPAIAELPATSPVRADRCRLRIGGRIESLEQQAAWETTGADHRVLATGQLVGGHWFNTILGAVGGDLYVATWSGTSDRRQGVVRIGVTSGAVSEVAPLEVDGAVRDGVVWAGALWGVRRGALVRMTAEGAKEVASDVASEARVVRTTAGLAVVEDGELVRPLAGDLLTPRAKATRVSGEAWDVHPDGTVVHAKDRALFRADRLEPLVVASDPITSVRVSPSTGAVVFSLARREPALSSVFVLEGRGVRHLLSATRHLVQGQETPFRLLRANATSALVATTCSDDEDAPSVMPIHLDLASGIVTYAVDQAAYPYVSESVALLESGVVWRDFGWQEDVELRFFVRQ